MFETPHHQRIKAALGCLRLDILNEAQCLFGGGTAIALQINEYRQSDDAAGFQKARDAYDTQVMDAIKRIHIHLQQIPVLVQTAFRALKVKKAAQNKISRFLNLSSQEALQTLSNSPEKTVHGV